MIQQAHSFRGEYIDLCAQIEQWAVDVISRQQSQSVIPAKIKLPYLFGQKLAFVKKLVDTEIKIFSNPARVTELLAKIESYTQLRADLAHATVRVIGQNSDTIFAFEVKTDQAFPNGTRRFWLTQQDAHRIISELKQLVKQIGDQKFAPPAC